MDGIGTFKDPQTNETVAITVLQNLVVVATGKMTGTTNVNLIPESPREYSTVTLLVLPEEAEILVLAGELGSLTLTLRNDNEVGLVASRDGVDIKTLLSGTRRKEIAEAHATKIPIIKGNVVDRGQQ